MIQHEDELYRMLDLYNINYDDVCIVGSSVIARAGFRNNNDFDIALKSSGREKLIQTHRSNLNISSSGNIGFSEFFEAQSGRYGIIGLNDDTVFVDEYSEKYNKVRIAKIEVEIAKKLRRLNAQDQKDLVEIGKASETHKFDWGKIFYLAYFNGTPVDTSVKVSYIRRIVRRVKHIIKSFIRH